MACFFRTIFLVIILDKGSNLTVLGVKLFVAQSTSGAVWWVGLFK